MSYTLPIDIAGRNFSLSNSNGKKIEFTQNKNMFTILGANHTPGEILTLNYESHDKVRREFLLSNKPLSDQIKIESSSPNCSLGAGITIEEQKIISYCEVMSKIDIKVEYKYQLAQTTFSLDAVKKAESGKWLVMIDSKATTEFSREGSTIILNDEPKFDAKIEIRFLPYD